MNFVILELSDKFFIIQWVAMLEATNQMKDEGMDMDEFISLLGSKIQEVMKRFTTLDNYEKFVVSLNENESLRNSFIEYRKSKSHNLRVMHKTVLEDVKQSVKYGLVYLQKSHAKVLNELSGKMIVVGSRDYTTALIILEIKKSEDFVNKTSPALVLPELDNEFELGLHDDETIVQKRRFLNSDYFLNISSDKWGFKSVVCTVLVKSAFKEEYQYSQIKKYILDGKLTAIEI
jgi:hypothetical protein